MAAAETGKSSDVEAATRQQRTMWEQLALPGELSRLGIDVLHSTHHTLPARGMVVLACNPCPCGDGGVPGVTSAMRVDAELATRTGRDPSR